MITDTLEVLGKAGFIKAPAGGLSVSQFVNANVANLV